MVNVKRLDVVICLILMFTTTSQALTCKKCEKDCSSMETVECVEAAGGGGGDGGGGDKGSTAAPAEGGTSAAAETTAAPAAKEDGEEGAAARKFIQRGVERAVEFKCVILKGKDDSGADVEYRGCSVDGTCKEFSTGITDPDCKPCDGDECNSSVRVKPLSLLFFMILTYLISGH